MDALIPESAKHCQKSLILRSSLSGINQIVEDKLNLSPFYTSIVTNAISLRCCKGIIVLRVGRRWVVGPMGRFSSCPVVGGAKRLPKFR